jgi:Class III cytochrome C family
VSLSRPARVPWVPTPDNPPQSGKNDSCLKCHQIYQQQGDSEEEFVTKPPKDLAENVFWLKKGTFRTTPQGHAICFTCHSQEGGLPPAANECGTCHKLISPGQALARKEAHGDFDPGMPAKMAITDRTTLEKWQRRDAVRFRHEWVTHVDLACADCHKVTDIDTLSESGPKVHVLSCGGGGSGCHITEDGGALNAEVAEKKSNPSFQCTKCHAIQGKQPVPQSHLSALTPVKTKQQ